MTFSTAPTTSPPRGLRRTPSLFPHHPPPTRTAHTHTQKCEQRTQSIHRNADHTREAIVLLEKKKKKRPSEIHSLKLQQMVALQKGAAWGGHRLAAGAQAAFTPSCTARFLFRSSAFHRQTLCRESLGLHGQLQAQSIGNQDGIPFHLPRPCLPPPCLALLSFLAKSTLVWGPWVLPWVWTGVSSQSLFAGIFLDLHGTKKQTC